MSYIHTVRRVILVTGAARSGKSEWAEILAKQSKKTVSYVATALVDPTDVEWQERIIQHQQRRPSHWRTFNVPQKLGQVFDQAQKSDCLLVDSLGTWVANLLDLEGDVWQQTSNDMLVSLKNSRADVILVGEETGWGVIPAYPSGRLFRDRLGYLSRQIGLIADTVYLVAGGHALDLTRLGQPINNSKL